MTTPLRTFPYTPRPELHTGQIHRVPVAIIGAGPTGLTLANDLALHGVPVIVFDNDGQVSDGSRAVCFAKRSLEIFDRLGCAQPMRKLGLTWNTSRIFYQDREIFASQSLPEDGHNHPAFINLQQYYVESFLIDGLLKRLQAEVRWRHTVIDHQPFDDYVRVTVETPEGQYQIDVDYLVACDGAHSPTRKRMGVAFPGSSFEDRFLVLDVEMHAPFPNERWFWFDPLVPGCQSILMHRQPDEIWRIEMQLSHDIDPQQALDPQQIQQWIRTLIGNGIHIKVLWSSLYTFHSRRLERLVHHRVIFAGDAAHLLSPFEARGANSGIQDADNLGWKLAMVVRGLASTQLLETYNHERGAAAAENQIYTDDSNNFIAPDSPGARALRNAVLDLARDCRFAQPMINAGRLTTPSVYLKSPLTIADEERWYGGVVPGAAAHDAPIQYADNDTFLLKQIGGAFDLLLYVDSPEQLDRYIAIQLRSLINSQTAIRPWLISEESWHTATFADIPILYDVYGYIRARYAMQDGSWYLFRPDQHVLLRRRTFQLKTVMEALQRALK